MRRTIIAVMVYMFVALFTTVGFANDEFFTQGERYGSFGVLIKSGQVKIPASDADYNYYAWQFQPAETWLAQEKKSKKLADYTTDFLKGLTSTKKNTFSASDRQPVLLLRRPASIPESVFLGAVGLDRSKISMSPIIIWWEREFDYVVNDLFYFDQIVNGKVKTLKKGEKGNGTYSAIPKERFQKFQPFGPECLNLAVPYGLSGHVKVLNDNTAEFTPVHDMLIKSNQYVAYEIRENDALHLGKLIVGKTYEIKFDMKWQK